MRALLCLKRTKLNNDLTANNETAGVSDVPFRFGCTDDGQYGYILKEGGADTVHPFSVDSGESIEDLAIDISYAYLGYPSTHSRTVNGEVIAVYWFIGTPNSTVSNCSAYKDKYGRTYYASNRITINGSTVTCGTGWADKNSCGLIIFYKPNS